MLNQLPAGLAEREKVRQEIENDYHGLIIKYGSHLLNNIFSSSANKTSHQLIQELDKASLDKLRNNVLDLMSAEHRRLGDSVRTCEVFLVLLFIGFAILLMVPVLTPLSASLGDFMFIAMIMMVFLFMLWHGLWAGNARYNHISKQCQLTTDMLRIKAYEVVMPGHEIIIMRWLVKP